MATTTETPTRRGKARRSKAPKDQAPRVKYGFKRWFREIGWRHLVGVIAVIWALFPVMYIISAALDPTGSVVSTSLFPQHFDLINFRLLFNDPNAPFLRWALNSILVAAAVVFVQLFFSALGAYAFSRFRFTGRRGGLLALLLIQMFPQFLATIALFNMFSDIGEVIPRLGLNTLLGYILVLCGGALGQVWLIKGSLDTIPKSLDEAAFIDGATHFQTFYKIILPLITPILAVTGLLVFVGVMGEFLMASTFLTQTDVKTLAVGLYGTLQGNRSNNLGIFAAGALLTATPVLVLFIYLQRFIVGGITAGGVKG